MSSDQILDLIGIIGVVVILIMKMQKNKLMKTKILQKIFLKHYVYLLYFVKDLNGINLPEHIIQ